ncbi:MAG: hypothetical protein HUU54_12270 [Ignavibacteriaceae bacterium]|nr:hypothetical protein [Ignavibacteriaceae bacterium]
MISAIFSVFLFIHSLIHIVGFVKAIKPDVLPQVKMSISRPGGLLWFVASDFLLFTFVAFIAGVDWWWILAIPALLLSQVLIIVFWSDAKFGTLFNVILLFAVILGYGTWSFNRMVENDFEAIKVNLPEKIPVITEESIGSLPPVIQRWIIKSNAVGKEIAYSILLTQSGKMKPDTAGEWIPFIAKQYFTVQQPAFIWAVDVDMMPGFFLAGRDYFKDGRGHMLIKALALAPVADSKGPEVDQGTMLRYMGEMVWFPSAALASYIRWEEVDSVTAIGYMDIGGMDVKGKYTFSPDGDFIRLEAERYYYRDTGSTLETWIVEAKPDGYKVFEGIRIPAVNEVTWRFKDGDYKWLKLEITGLSINPDIDSFK